ncbi:conserved protein of unknown function [Streptomyces sp. KY75]|nr:conserved protein of unknown function [Streptomyces sp. KY70]CAD5987736.1 conserved protein of unknown function [Streptomyces sp. KY75]
MRRGHRHESVAAGLLDRLLAGAHQRVVGAGERDPVHDHQLAARPRHVHALPEREGAEEAGLRVGGEVLDQLAEGLLALEQDRLVQPAPQLLGGRLRSPHGGEQPQRAAARRLHQLRQLVEHVRTGPLAPRGVQMPGDIEDALLRVVERGADVQPLPLRDVIARRALGGEPQGGAHPVEVPAELQRGRGQDHRALGEELLAQQPGDGERGHPHRGAEPVVLLVPDDVVLRALGDALGYPVDRLDRGQGLLTDGVLVLDRLVPGGADRGDHRTGRVPQRHQRVPEVLGHILQPPRERQLHHPLEPFGSTLERVGGLLVDQLRRPPDRPVDLGRGQLAGGDPGDPGDQLVRLVHDQHLVRGEHRGALDGVDREQGVVGDDHIGELGAFTGRLREALRPVRALRRPEALARGDRDLRPGPVRDAGGEVVPVPRLRVARPLPQPQQVLAQLAGGRRRLELVEQPFLLVLRDPFVEPVQAEVVRPALEHRVLRAPAQQRVQGLHRARKVPLHQLPLEGEGGRGHDDPLPVRQRGHQVAEGLARAGAGLDEQVGLVVDRLGDGLGHGGLAGALRTADGGDGGVQELGEEWLRHSPTTLRRATDNGGHSRIRAEGCSGLGTVPWIAACGRLERSR